MRCLLVFISLCSVCGCGRVQSTGEHLAEADPGDPTPPVLSITDANSVLFNLTYSPDGKRLAAGSKDFDSVIRVWDAAVGKQLLEIETEGRAIVGLEFTPDGSKLVGALEGGNGGPNLNTAPIIVWDSESGEMLQMFESGFKETAKLALSQDGRMVACGGPTKFIDAGGTPENPKNNSMEAPIKVWELETERVLNEFIMTTASAITCLEFSPDSSQLASSSPSGHNVHLWSLADGELTKLPKCAAHVSGLAYSPDGKQIAYGCGRTDKIWSTEIGEELLTLGESRRILGYLMGNLNHIAFSPDGKHLAAASGFGVHVWDLTTRECVRTLKDPNGVDDSRKRIYGEGESPFISREVVYSPDGRQIACEFWKIIVWKTE